MSGQRPRGLLARLLGRDRVAPRFDGTSDNAAATAAAAAETPEIGAPSPEPADDPAAAWGPVAALEPVRDGDLGLLGDEAPSWRPAPQPDETAGSPPAVDVARTPGRPVAVVMSRLCLNTRAEASCSHCLGQCPGPDALTAGPRGVPVVDPERCTGCGLCVPGCRSMPQALRMGEV